jgi:hypothetical protein
MQFNRRNEQLPLTVPVLDIKWRHDTSIHVLRSRGAKHFELFFNLLSFYSVRNLFYDLLRLGDAGKDCMRKLGEGQILFWRSLSIELI